MYRNNNLLYINIPEISDKKIQKFYLIPKNHITKDNITTTPPSVKRIKQNNKLNNIVNNFIKNLFLY